jgi:hypothetical protein
MTTIANPAELLGILIYSATKRSRPFRSVTVAILPSFGRGRYPLATDDHRPFRLLLMALVQDRIAHMTLYCALQANLFANAASYVLFIDFGSYGRNVSLRMFESDISPPTELICLFAASIERTE